jgi:hypothetical protein
MNKDFLTAGELGPAGLSRRRHGRLDIVAPGLFAIRYRLSRPTLSSQTYPLNPQQPLRLIQVINSCNSEDSMTFRANDDAIDEIVASCDGDIHGALKALLLVNEQLEAELAEFYAAVGLNGMARGSNVLH